VKPIAVAVAVGIAALVLAGSARAVPPPLVSVGQQARHPTATLGPLPGVDFAFIYVATKPDRASDGSFLQENIVASDILTDDEIARGSWLYEGQLDPGGYYVMARTFDFECYLNPSCIEGFSNMLTLTVPKPASGTGRPCSCSALSGSAISPSPSRRSGRGFPTVCVGG
jgi:hypothetical protein